MPYSTLYLIILIDTFFVHLLSVLYKSIDLINYIKLNYLDARRQIFITVIPYLKYLHPSTYIIYYLRDYY